MAEPEKASTKKEAAVYCIPGDVIGPTTFCCGVHTHVYENQVVASCVGRLEKIKDEKLGKVFRFFLDKIFIKFSFSFPFFHFNHQMQYKDIANIVRPSDTNIVPTVGAIVICRVLF